MSTCRGCGKRIEWIKTISGKAMPLDPDPIRVVVDQDSVITVVLNDGSVVRARLAEPDEDAVMGRISHFATCPQAESFRKR